MRSQFIKGAADGIPIGLGYLTVSFGFGIAAVRSGLTALAAVIISATNLTSAGQAAGVDLIASGGSLLEMALIQLVINIRYALMAIVLSQKLDKSFTLPHRFAASYGITDEIFAVAAAHKGKLTPQYMYGLIFSGFAGWTAGTFLGAAAGTLLPEQITNAMGIMLYGMFIAIVVPPARKSRSILTAVLIASGLAVLFRYALRFVSSGFAVIICAVTAAAAAAVLFPVNDDEEEEP